MPGRADMRYQWVGARMEALDDDEMRELVIDAWRMCVPKKGWPPSTWRGSDRALAAADRLQVVGHRQGRGRRASSQPSGRVTRTGLRGLALGPGVGAGQESRSGVEAVELGLQVGDRAVAVSRRRASPPTG